MTNTTIPSDTAQRKKCIRCGRKRAVHLMNPFGVSWIGEHFVCKPARHYERDECHVVPGGVYAFLLDCIDKLLVMFPDRITRVTVDPASVKVVETLLDKLEAGGMIKAGAIASRPGSRPGRRSFPGLQPDAAIAKAATGTKGSGKSAKVKPVARGKSGRKKAGKSISEKRPVKGLKKGAGTKKAKSLVKVATKKKAAVAPRKKAKRSK